MGRDPLDVAWAAGLFEGEGCLTMARDPRRDYRRVSARLGSTDRDVVERFATIVGFGHVNEKRRKDPLPHYKPLYEWATNQSALVRDVIDLFRPYLGERRLARADEVYAESLRSGPHSSTATRCPNGHAYTPENTLVEKRRGDKTVRRCRTCRRADARRWEARRNTA